MAIGEVGGYSAIASCALILFLVLRRSMLHALGFTYAEILPLHRWLGVAIVFWSVVHTLGYITYYVLDQSLGEAINFYDIGRSTMNLMGFVALVMCSPFCILALVFYFQQLHLSYTNIIFFMINNNNTVCAPYSRLLLDSSNPSTSIPSLHGSPSRHDRGFFVGNHCSLPLLSVGLLPLALDHPLLH